MYEHEQDQKDLQMRTMLQNRKNEGRITTQVRIK